MNELIEPLRDLLEAHCPPSVVRAIEGEGSSGPQRDALMAVLAQSGFVDAMVAESQGGAGLSLAQAFPVFELCGRYLLPVPLPEMIVQRATGAKPDLEMTACLIAAQMAGAMQRVLEMTLQFANDRQQFGRPLGKFQAIQHQLAVMAEQVLAARMAAQIGCSAATTLNAAIAKARASEAAVEVVALAHSIHGAIGFTADYDLQLFTRRLHAWRLQAGSESYWHEVLGQAVLSSPQGEPGQPHTLDILRNIAWSAYFKETHGLVSSFDP
jgi:alkylation response protein AidB-like acyl-CoA dehydrogenase